MDKAITRAIYPFRLMQPQPLSNALTASKIPEVTLVFWIMKIAATTLGETAGDLLSMTMHIGYGVSSVILISLFGAALAAQLSSRKFHPWLYWAVILATSTAGTTMSDFMDRTLGLGYATGSFILIGILCVVLLIWRLTEGSLSVQNISSTRAECFYWTAILFSNTLGTALGDYLADDSGLGFLGGAAVIGSAIGAIALAAALTNWSRVALFWLAFVLTRPFGATLGDFLTKAQDDGGLGLGTIGTSAVLLAILAFFVFRSSQQLSKSSTRPVENGLADTGL